MMKCKGIIAMPPNLRLQPTPDTRAFWEWFCTWLSSQLVGIRQARLKRLPLGSQTEMTLYSLCYPALSEEDDEFIRSYRREHDLPYRDVVNHHFTIVFGIRDLSKDVYVRHVREIAASQQPISFVCRYAMLGNDASDDNYYVFLVPDEGYSMISLLHDCLYTGPFAPFHRLDIPYIPHIGVATIEDAPKVKKLCDKLNTAGINIAGTLNHITICEYAGNRITDLERISFGA